MAEPRKMTQFRLPLTTREELSKMANAQGGSMTDVIIQAAAAPDQVYVMKNLRNGLFKIGVSKNPSFREKTLQSEEPEIMLISATPAKKYVERILHKIFKEKRVRGEWFKLEEEEAQKISDMVLNGLEGMFPEETRLKRKAFESKSEFARKLRRLVDPIGTAKAAELCGVTPRSIQLWCRGAEPCKAVQAGALILLGDPDFEHARNQIDLPKPITIKLAPSLADSRAGREPIQGGLLRTPKK